MKLVADAIAVTSGGVGRAMNSDPRQMMVSLKWTALSWKLVWTAAALVKE